jgi:putative hydrolase of the HAD superfamily
MLTTVFFDAAGTLFETRRPVGDFYAAVARDFGADVSGKAISAAFRHSFGNAPGLAFGPGRPPSEVRRLEREWWRQRVAETFAGLHQFDNFEAYFAALFEFFGDPANWVVFDDVFPALDELRAAGLRLGVISNFDSRLYLLLEGLGLAPYFQSVTISSEAGYAKPAAELFRCALAATDTNAAGALHVGDAPHLDVSGANAAEIAAILIRRPHEGTSAVPLKSNPVTVISSFAELPPIARRRMGK